MLGTTASPSVVAVGQVLQPSAPVLQSPLKTASPRPKTGSGAAAAAAAVAPPPLPSPPARRFSAAACAVVVGLTDAEDAEFAAKVAKANPQILAAAEKERQKLAAAAAKAASKDKSAAAPVSDVDAASAQETTMKLAQPAVLAALPTVLPNIVLGKPYVSFVEHVCAFAVAHVCWVV